MTLLFWFSDKGYLSAQFPPSLPKGKQRHFAKVREFQFEDWFVAQHFKIQTVSHYISKASFIVYPGWKWFWWQIHKGIRSFYYTSVTFHFYIPDKKSRLPPPFGGETLQGMKTPFLSIGKALDGFSVTVDFNCILNKQLDRKNYLFVYLWVWILPFQITFLKTLILIDTWSINCPYSQCLSTSSSSDKFSVLGQKHQALVKQSG